MKLGAHCRDRLIGVSRVGGPLVVIADTERFRCTSICDVKIFAEVSIRSAIGEDNFWPSIVERHRDDLFELIVNSEIELSGGELAT